MSGWSIDFYVPWRGGSAPASGSETTPSVHRDMGEAIQSLWVYYMGSKRSASFPNPDTAPVSRITAFDTATDFVMEDTNKSYDPEYELPWFMQKGFDTIKAKVYVAFPFYVSGLNIRLQTQPLVSAVAATSGRYQSQGLPTAWHRSMNSWALDPVHWSVDSYNCEIKPTLPADRRVALRVQASLDILGDNPAELSFEFAPRLIGLHIEDQMSAIANYTE